MTEATMRERLTARLEALPQSALGSPIYDTDYAAIVDAVLAEVETPTAAMIMAASLYRIEEAATGYGADPTDVWCDMIAEARKP